MVKYVRCNYNDEAVQIHEAYSLLDKETERMNIRVCLTDECEIITEVTKNDK